MISFEYIRGLIEGEGCFSFCTVPIRGGGLKPLIPAFILGMSSRDRDLIDRVRRALKLKNKVYVYHYQQSDGHKRQPRAILIVRDIGALRTTIVPLCYNKLHGHKGRQFNEWIEKIGSNPRVPAPFKLIYRLHKNGFYDKDGRFT